MNSQNTPESLKAPFLSSTLSKQIMSLAGLFWLMFVSIHMLGNLLIFVSPKAYNYYGYLLEKSFLTKVFEVFLVLSLLAHVVIGIKLALQNKKTGSSSAYKKFSGKRSSLLRSSLIFQGLLILAFVVYHLITFKFGPEYKVVYDGVEMRDFYKLVMETFQNPLLTLGYIIALITLFFHLVHGTSSFFKTFGIYIGNQKLMNKVAWVYGSIVAVGFLSIPIYFYLFY